MTRRVESFDVARGTAMLFVCLSHFVSVFPPAGTDTSVSPSLAWWGRIASTVSMVASPTFICISGMVVGYLFRANPGVLPSLRRKLIDRGLFMLVIGHLLQVVPGYAVTHDLSSSVKFEFITDTIAVAIIVGPSLLLSTTPRVRVIAGVALVFISWFANSLWYPSAPVAVAFSRYAFGTPHSEVLVGFPTIPWLGVYLLATVLGERVGEYARGGALQRGERLLVRVGIVSAALASVMIAVRHTLRAYQPVLFRRHDIVAELFALAHKFPPGPVYFLFFGGCGLILTSMIFALDRHYPSHPGLRVVGTIGRASFLIFVLQGYVYYLALPAIGLGRLELWPLYFGGTLLLFLMAASIWNALDGNRYLTIGLWRTVPIVRSSRSLVRTSVQCAEQPSEATRSRAPIA